MSTKKNPDLLSRALGIYTAAKVTELVDLQKKAAAQSPPSQQTVNVEKVWVERPTPGDALSEATPVPTVRFEKPESSFTLVYALLSCLGYLVVLAVGGKIVPMVNVDAHENIPGTFLASAFSWAGYLLGVCEKSAVCVDGHMAPNVPLGLILLVTPLLILQVIRNGDLRTALLSVLAFGIVGSYLVSGRLHLQVALGVVLSSWVAIVTIVVIIFYFLYVLLTDPPKV